MRSSSCFETPSRELIFRRRHAEYWADSASTTPAPGGGIQRIGYDQARYDQAVQEVIFKVESDPVRLAEKAEREAKEAEEKFREKERREAVEVKKEDVQLLVSSGL